MIDCGEGTQMQLRRASVRFTKLGHVFISHLHGDHCFGLIGMISTFGMLGRTATLHVHAPEELRSMLDAQLKFFCQDLGYSIEFHAVDTTVHRVIYEDRSLQVESIPLSHRVPCCGFLFREKPLLPHIRRDMIDFYQIPVSQIQNIKSGQGYELADGTCIPHERLVTPADEPRSYAYCSDTKFSRRVIKSVEGVDWLYHEATYDDSLRIKAHKRYHSTALEAATVAHNAGVGQLIIGHFSKRYLDETPLLQEAQSIFPATRLANEGLVIDLNQK